MLKSVVILSFLFVVVSAQNQGKCKDEDDSDDEYNEGDHVVSKNGCSNCACSGGKFQCSNICDLPKKCKGKKNAPCCDFSCNTCLVNGEEFDHGEELPSNNICDYCICNYGNPLCSKQVCPPNPPNGCTYVTNPKKCCDTKCEKKCVDNDNNEYSEGDIVPSRRPCRSCVCSGGEVVCSPICKKPKNCKRKKKQPPKCCDFQCLTCTIGNQVYAHGAVIPSNDVCETCKCNAGNRFCTKKSCPKNPPPGCTYVKNPKTCCEVECNQCVTDTGVYNDGDNIPTKNPCEICTCNKGKVQCAILDCDKPPQGCTYVPTATICCNLQCNQCVTATGVYNDGENIPTNDPCRICHCDKGKVVCAIIDCAPPPKGCTFATNPTTCCSYKCNGKCIDFDKKEYAEGASVPSPGGGSCTKCVCSNGQIKCSPSCVQKPPCTEKPNQNCCDFKCHSCTQNNIEYKHGAIVPTGDPCRNCTCNAQSILCKQSVCAKPPFLCSYTNNPLKCCEVKCVLNLGGLLSYFLQVIFGFKTTVH